MWRAPNGVFLKKQPADTMSVNEVWEEEDHRTVAICPDVYGTYIRIWDGSEDFGSSDPVDIAKRIRDDKHVSTVNDVQCSVAGRPSFISKTGEGVYRELRDDRGRISRHDGPAIIYSNGDVEYVVDGESSFSRTRNIGIAMRRNLLTCGNEATLTRQECSCATHHRRCERKRRDCQSRRGCQKEKDTIIAVEKKTWTRAI